MTRWGRIEDGRLLRGAGSYTDDIDLPGAAVAEFVRSPHAHARIRRIATAAARAVPGMLAVFTGADMQAAGLGSIRPLARRDGADGAPMFLPPRLPLTPDACRFVGDPVALVVAEDLAAARDAAEAVEIDWEDLPAVTDIAAAVEDGAPLVWPEADGNVAYLWSAGDPAAVADALARAAQVTRLTVRVSRTAASPIEPRAALAECGPAGRLRLTAGLQAPWQSRAILAQVLGIPPEALEIVVPDVGGSFGLKGQTFPEYGALLHAARVLRRPIRWRATRAESLVADDHGRDVVMHGTLALDADGRILAVALEGLSALGAYLSTRGTLTTVANIPGICGPYRVPAACARMRGVYTHTASISPYRGAGRPEASLLIERLIDEAAAERGRDPVALRRLNLLVPGELPYTNPLGFTYDSGDFPAALDRVLELADRAGFPARREASAGRGRLRGLGMSSVIAASAPGQFETARATLLPGGRVRLECGAVSHGQGHASVFARLAADALGIDHDRIDYVSGRSDLFDAAVGSFGSRSAAIAGPAVEAAARGLVEALLPFAACRLGAAPEAVSYAAGAFATSTARLTLAELHLDAPVSREVRFTPEGATFPNGAHVCEVEVDPETGAIEVVRHTAVEDVGTVLDETVVEGQTHGGIAQALGQCLSERVVYDPGTGQPLTGSFMDFAMPRAADLPAFEVASRPVPTAGNPLGVKGAGEGGTIGALPAFQNALADALRSYGVRDIPMPATPEAVWRLMRSKR